MVFDVPLVESVIFPLYPIETSLPEPGVSEIDPPLIATEELPLIVVVAPLMLMALLAVAVTFPLVPVDCNVSVFDDPDVEMVTAPLYPIDTSPPDPGVNDISPLDPVEIAKSTLEPVVMPPVVRVMLELDPPIIILSFHIRTAVSQLDL